jgi:hypothetical protein
MSAEGIRCLKVARLSRGRTFVGGVVAALAIAGSGVALSGPAEAATGSGITSLSTSDGSTIENGFRNTIWYKATPGYHDFNLTYQQLCEHYTGYYQNSSSGVWHEASSKSHYLCGGTNSPWEVLITNVKTGTPMVIGTRTAYEVPVKVAY